VTDWFTSGRIQKADPQLYRRNLPFLHTSTWRHCMWWILLGLPSH